MGERAPQSRPRWQTPSIDRAVVRMLMFFFRDVHASQACVSVPTTRSSSVPCFDSSLGFTYWFVATINEIATAGLKPQLTHRTNSSAGVRTRHLEGAIDVHAVMECICRYTMCAHASLLCLLVRLRRGRCWVCTGRRQQNTDMYGQYVGRANDKVHDANGTLLPSDPQPRRASPGTAGCLRLGIPRLVGQQMENGRSCLELQ